ncbi:hypothetical protein FSP39_025494 [Pinctada imbricata]|uniref:[histone H3]-dimethyl-L-lysine(36) demethylase n=1 Tax=Pinctada imbricata TaxID=66713 RepID=A0AA88XIR6_PINIB|nr:hypothetical protein FSP39_025494 [Pinctada imbricata]
MATMQRVKERKTYTDVDIDDDEIEGKRNYALDEKLRSPKYCRDYVQQLKGEEFCLSYIQEHGLEKPIVFFEKSGLGLRVPSENFKVCDVKQCVGSRRMLDVMDVTTQKGMEMSMREWVTYYENMQRERLLNVISLEFSHTKLENYVESPNLVRQIDWVDTVWPRHLKECQTESTNIIERMKYPKVQKYCLMSVAGCYTDFHIDFGGTSVWYHILHGEKVFWLIPPTERNVEIYTNWVLSGKQGDVFLADHVEGCERIELKAGYTFIIPSGWIHAVFTPKDSLVFGGNFLHSYNIVNQLRVSEVEDKTHVPQKFRYPFYAEIAWYVLARYITCMTGKQCLVLPAENKENVDDKRESSPFLQDESSRPSSRGSQDEDQTVVKTPDGIQQPSTPKFPKKVMIELTRIDQAGRIKSSSDDENSSFRRIKSPRKSSSDSCSSADTEIYEKNEDFGNSQSASERGDSKPVKKLKMEADDPMARRASQRTFYLTKWELEGLRKLVDWLEELPLSKKGVPRDMMNADEVLTDIKRLLMDHEDDNQKLAVNGEPLLVWPPSKKPPKPKVYKMPSGSKGSKSQASKNSASTGIRRRRVRCRKCEPCTRTDCGECNFCKDMKKYGGPGRMKQSCKSRQCLAPVISNAAFCMICGKDERTNTGQGETSTSLMECGICWEIVHPECLRQKYENLDNEGNINEDLPNSWECPKCCHDGKQGQLKPRIVKVKKEEDIQSPKPESMTSSNESLDTLRLESDTESKRVTAKPAEDVKQEEDTEEYEDQEGDLEVDPDNVNDRVTSPGLPALKTPPSKAKLKTPKYVSPSQRSLEPNIGKLSGITPKSNLTITHRGKSLSPGGRGRGIKKGVMTPDSTTTEEMVPESVFTRSGRKVKRSPQFDDDNMDTESSKKRPRREGLVSKTELTDESGVKVLKGQGYSSPGLQKKMKTYQNYGSSTEEDSLSPERYEGVMKKKISTVGKYGMGKSKSLPTTPSQSGKRGTLSKKYPTDTPDKQNKPPKSDLKGVSHTGVGMETNATLTCSKFVVRPVAPPPPPDCVELEDGDIHPLKRKHWTKIFSYLSYPDLARCLSVSKAFNRWAMNHELWSVIDLSRRRIIQVHLIGMVKRQPKTLHLNAVVMTQNQLSWLLARLPQLKNLSLASCSWATVSALCFSACPLLHDLNLSWSLGLNETCFKDLVSPPSDLRPGMREVSRLHKLKQLRIAGTDIEDASLGHIAQYLTSLEKLDISFCQRISDRGIQLLIDSNNGALSNTLKTLDISGLRDLTEVSMESLVKCNLLSSVKIVKCPKITSDVVKKFPRKSVAFLK